VTRSRPAALHASGNSYVVPSSGGILNWTLRSWSHQANSIPGSLTMKIWHQVSGLTYQAVSHDGPRPLTVSTLNTFNTQLSVKAGDVLGLHNIQDGVGCVFGTGDPGDVPPYYFGDLQDGQSAVFSTAPEFRLNISAVIEPTNTFTFGATTRNKKKGTATLTATVPNPGELTGSGKGVKVAAAALLSKTVTASGNVKLTIRAKGKKKTTLNETGKVKVKPKITYTPTGGDPRTQSIKVKLKKNL
jgi:hypothetical protein